MSTKRDYYEVLEVSKTASESEIKSAYRKKAMQYHPDRNPGDKVAEEKFKEATEAYDVLRDPDKRAAYDKYGHEAFEGGPGGGGRSGFTAGGFNDFSDIFSQFSDIFGGGFGGMGGMGGGRQGGANEHQRGADLRYNLQITLEEAFNSKTETIKFANASTCGTCKGTGCKGGKKPETCSTCNGQGVVRHQKGFFIMETTCSKCHGTGYIIKDPCPDCHGEGRVNQPQSLDIKIPAGIQDGEKIKLSGKGEAGLRGGPAGDLYVFVNVKPHKLYTRKGNDLYCDVPVKITKAMLGGEIEIPVIEGGKTRFKIPKGTQTNTTFRLAGKGMSIYNSSKRGDLFVKVIVEIPVNLDSKAEKLVRELDELLDDTSRPKTGFFDKFFN